MHHQQPADARTLARWAVTIDERPIGELRRIRDEGFRNIAGRTRRVHTPRTTWAALLPNGQWAHPLGPSPGHGIRPLDTLRPSGGQRTRTDALTLLLAAHAARLCAPPEAVD